MPFDYEFGSISDIIIGIEESLRRLESDHYIAVSYASSNETIKNIEDKIMMLRDRREALLNSATPNI